MKKAQRERLAMLAEEAGEIVQMVGKSLRHGLDSYHPDDPLRTPNRELLRRELKDISAVFQMMLRAGDIEDIQPLEVADAMRSKHRYTHHQETPR